MRNYCDSNTVWSLCAAERHNIRVVADGRALDVSVVCPRMMTDIIYLHK